MMHNMDWDDLRFVSAVTRLGSLNAAGKALGVRHTTVGRRIGRLETQLGVRLFDRTPEGLRPTPAAIDLSEVATETASRIDDATARVQGRDTSLSGALRVSTLDWLFELHAPVFASFCDRYPDVSLTVLATETEVSLFRREADVAFRLTNTPPETVVGRRVGTVRFAVYGHRSLVRDPEAPWSAYPWLHWDERTEMARWLDHWLAANAPGARIALRLSEGTLLRRAAMRQGIGVHPLPIAEGERDPQLVRIGPVLEDFDRALWLLTLPAMRHTSRVRALLDHVSEALRSDRTRPVP